jgi:hypothetical protein
MLKKHCERGKPKLDPATAIGLPLRILGIHAAAFRVAVCSILRRVAATVYPSGVGTEEAVGGVSVFVYRTLMQQSFGDGPRGPGRQARPSGRAEGSDFHLSHGCNRSLAAEILVIRTEVRSEVTYAKSVGIWGWNC